MKKILLVLCLALSGCGTAPAVETSNKDFCAETTPQVHLPAGDVLALAQEKDPQQFTFAEQKGAEIIPVDDNQSYAVWWQPDGFDIDKDTVIVSLHGHGDFAIQDFKVWYPELAKYKVAYLGLQWWFGRSLENEGYYEPDQIYRLIAEELKAKGVPAGHVIFQGFSMGGARSYGVSLYDSTCGTHYFGVNIANSGPWEDDYPLYAKILTGNYGATPFENTHWILFCGEKDINEYAKTSTQANVCDSTENTQTTLTKLGATVDLFIKDPNGDHGSFMMNASNVEQGMDKAMKLLTK